LTVENVYDRESSCCYLLACFRLKRKTRNAIQYEVLKEWIFVPAKFNGLRELLFFAGLHERHQQELENLTMTGQPFKTLKFFVLAMVQYCKRSVFYLLAKGGWLMLLSTVVAAVGIVLVTIDGPHEKVLQRIENCRYFEFT